MATTIDVYNVKGEAVNKTELSEEVFGCAVNGALLHQAVVNHLANKRRGTAKTKNRAEVSGSGVKPWKQKGTGRARVGDNRSPVWRRGGVVFGPRPRDYSYSLTQKTRRAALISALSSKLKEGNIIVLDNLKLDRIKTKDMLDILSSLKVGNKLLLILTNPDDKIKKSARNIADLHVRIPLNVSTYDVLNHEKLIITEEALAQLVERLARKGKKDKNN